MQLFLKEWLWIVFRSNQLCRNTANREIYLWLSSNIWFIWIFILYDGMAEKREQLGNFWTKVSSKTVNMKLLSKLTFKVFKWAKERTQKKCLWAEKKWEGFKLGSLNWHSNSCSWKQLLPGHYEVLTTFVQADNSGRMAVAAPYLPWLKNAPWLDLFPMLKSCTGKEQDNLAKKCKWKCGFHEVLMKKSLHETRTLLRSKHLTCTLPLRKVERTLFDRPWGRNEISRQDNPRKMNL